MTSVENMRAAVIGHPVSHSLSPAMFSAAFAAEDVAWTYSAIDVTESQLAEFLSNARSEGFAALSVTMPLKSLVVAHMDSLDDASRVLGAVNSVVITPESMLGFNTDGDGCCDALERVGGITIEGSRAVVFGAGGAARSIARALVLRGAAVRIVNRSESRAHDVVEKLRSTNPDADCAVGSLVDLRDADIVVNSTPVGMTGSGDSLIRDWSLVNDEAIVLDAVYEPLDTGFLRSARDRGMRTVDGLWMLVYQAVRQYSLWFERGVSPALMRQAAEQELATRHK